MGNPTRQSIAFGIHLSPHSVRRVWAAVTKHPQMTLRELSDETGLAFGPVGAALRMLRAAGYIDFEPNRTGRTIIVPFVIIGKP